MSFVKSADSVAGSTSSALRASRVAKEKLDQFRGHVVELMRRGELPNLFEKCLYKVFTLAGSSFGSHWSVVLTNNQIKYFTVEMVVMKNDEDTDNQVHPRMLILDESLQERLNYKGEVEDTGYELINKALGVMEKFGDYSNYANNCQKYCNSVLKEYGLGEKMDWTDAGKAAAGIGGGVGGLAGVGLTVLAVVLAILKLK